MEIEETPKYVKFIAIAQYFWGRGNTKEEAMEKLRQAGFFGRATDKRVKMFEMPAGTVDPQVNNMGQINWGYESENTPRAQPTKVPLK